MRRKHDSADKMAETARLAVWETNGKQVARDEERNQSQLIDFTGSSGWNRTNDQRINSESGASSPKPHLSEVGKWYTPRL